MARVVQTLSARNGTVGVSRASEDMKQTQFETISSKTRGSEESGVRAIQRAEPVRFTDATADDEVLFLVHSLAPTLHELKSDELLIESSGMVDLSQCELARPGLTDVRLVMVSRAKWKALIGVCIGLSIAVVGLGTALVLAVL